MLPPAVCVQPACGTNQACTNDCVCVSATNKCSSGICKVGWVELPQTWAALRVPAHRYWYCIAA